jgi:predicted phosphodiesterase
MDRIAIIADIHGNFPALRAVLDDIESHAVSKIYCLGDLVGYYCMINEVIDAMCERGVESVMGNHDYALAWRDGEIPRSKSATLVLKRQQEYITARNLAYLKALPRRIEFQLGDRSYVGVHGGLDDELDEYIRDISADYLDRHAFHADVLLSGQTHVPLHVVMAHKIYANPGSVGQPRDGDPRASYLVVEGTQFTFRRVSYDVADIVDRMHAMGFPAYLAQRLAAGRGV